MILTKDTSKFTLEMMKVAHGIIHEPLCYTRSDETNRVPEQSFS